MGNITDSIASAFRDFVTDGVASSGAHEPIKADIRALGPLIETAIGNAGLGALVSVTKTTKALLDADLTHAADVVALVYADATDENNDLYVKTGASGAGSWTNTGAFHAAFNSLALPYAASVTNASRARAGISGRITALTWSGIPFASTPTVTIGAGEQWEENNAGVVKRRIAAIAATALAVGQGIVVNFDSGATDGTGAYIPTKVAIASGAQVGWQTAGRYVLVARDSNGLLFGHYVNNSPDLTGAGTTAALARAWISGKVSSATWAGSTPTVILSDPGYLWVENNAGNPLKTIAPVAATALEDRLGLIVDFDAGPVDGSGRYIPTVGAISGEAAKGWQSDKNKFVLVGVDAAGNLFGEYTLPSDNPDVGIYDAEVGFSATAGTPLPSWDAATRTLSWPEMVLICKKASYGGRIKLQAGSVVFPAGNYYVATLDLSAVNNVLTPNTAVTVSSYVGSGGWEGDDTRHIPLFCVSGDTAYPVRFPPVRGSLIGPGTPGAVSAYDPSEIVVLQGATQIDIYKKGSNPASNRYIRYRMQRVTTPAINSDVWRWNEVWECERTGEYTFSALLRLAQNGENEMAIRQDGKADFMGGTAHGDEELFAVTFMVDGVVKALGGAANYRARRVEFLQGSDLYEVDTVTPKSNRVAKSYKRWVFDAGAVEITNHVVWEDSITLAQCFMTMLTWLRTSRSTQISDKGFRAPLWAEEDISPSYSIAVIGGGTGYTDGEAVTLTAADGSGIGLIGTVSVVSGAVTAVQVSKTTLGSGYTLDEIVNITALDGTGTGATGTLNSGFSPVYSTANIAKVSGPNGHSAEVEIVEGWDKPGRGFYFSPAVAYNKFYFEFCGAAYVTAVGEIMRSRAIYRIDTSN